MTCSSASSSWGCRPSKRHGICLWVSYAECYGLSFSVTHVQLICRGIEGNVSHQVATLPPRQVEMTPPVIPGYPSDATGFKVVPEAKTFLSLGSGFVWNTLSHEKLKSLKLTVVIMKSEDEDYSITVRRRESFKASLRKIRLILKLVMIWVMSLLTASSLL